MREVPNTRLLIEEHSLKMDQLKRDVDTMLGIGDRKLRITLNNVG